MRGLKFHVNSIFYTISGLPVHALIVHFAVVILPVSSFAIFVSVYIPRFRKNFAFASLIGTFVGTGSAVIAKQSGEALSAHIGLPKNHARYGSVLQYFAFAFFCLALFWYRNMKRKPAIKANKIGHLTAVFSLVVIALTFITGHTGAQAVWKARIEALNSATSTDSSNQASNSLKKISRAEIAKHSKPTDCWSVINGQVYDLTKWINQHPGGPSVIEMICGKDGSVAFNGQHAGQRRPENELKNYSIGSLG